MNKSVTVAEAKMQFSALIDLARDGSEIVITRHGREVARLGPPMSHSQPVDLKKLRRVQQRLPGWSEPSTDLLKRLRSEK